MGTTSDSPDAPVHAVVIEFASIQRDATPIDRMFGTSGWAGTVNGMPALVLSYYGGARLAWYDGRWMQSKPFWGVTEIYDTLGIESR